MRIILTNDDGIFAPGMQVLISWARTIGEVVVYAPKSEQSGKSHSIEIHKPFEVKRVQHPTGVEAYSVDSTPADCVRYAILGRHEKPDLVISGVNCGHNIGMDIIYSGTVGAIFEAAALGVKGVAFSTGFTSFDAAQRELPRVWAFFTHHRLLDKGSLFNVNIPQEVVTDDILITRQGGPYFSDEFPACGDDLVMPTGICVHESRGDLTLDTDATLSGHITVTPLTVDRTNLALFDQLK